jgi:poly(3-hydroxybutyrate) depolymerase
MSSNFLKILPAILILFGCAKKYEHLKPGSVTTIEVNVNDPSGHPKSIASSYSVPNKYTPTQEWPLLIALHGYGGHAVEFHDLWKPVTDSLGFVLVTPQGENQTSEGFGWAWGINSERFILASLDIVLKATHIDPNRVYISGFSAGGAISYAMALMHPRTFRGIAALGAPFDVNLISENIERMRLIGAYSGLRVYIGHGTLESNFVSDAQLAAKTFQRLDAIVKLVLYEGIGHTLPEPMENELTKILEFLDSKD